MVGLGYLIVLEAIYSAISYGSKSVLSNFMSSANA